MMWMSYMFWDITTPCHVIYQKKADIRIYTEVKKLAVTAHDRKAPLH
jgi:hypothetical protein